MSFNRIHIMSHFNAIPVLAAVASLSVAACVDGDQSLQDGPLGGVDASILSDRVPLIPDEVSCPSCGIEAFLQVRLGTMEDPVTIIRGSRVTRNRDGEFIVGPLAENGILAVYGKTGGFAHTIGRAGSGPGELRRVHDVQVGPGDSVWVLGSGRVVVLSPNFEFVRGSPLPPGAGAFRFVVQPDGAVVINNYRSQQPSFMAVSPQFEEPLVFGPALPTTNQNSYLLEFRLTGREEGGILASRGRFRYEILAFDQKGTLLRRWERRPPWFPRSAPTGQGIDMTQIFRSPQIRDLRQDADGRLWVMIKPYESDAPEIPITVDGETGPIDLSLWETGETIIEAIDLHTGKVQFRDRVPAPLMAFIDAKSAFAIRDSPDGLLQVEVWNLDVRQGAGE